MNGQPVVLPAGAAVDDRTQRLAALFESHADRLYRLARRLSDSADDARDLVQETFVRAAKSLRSVPGGLPGEEAWLVRVLVNLQRDAWRKTAVRERSRILLRGEPAAVEAGAESALIAKRSVQQALETLAPRRRAVIVMHEIEGLDVSAIASLLGITRTTVRWHLSKGRRELIRLLRATLTHGNRTAEDAEDRRKNPVGSQD